MRVRFHILSHTRILAVLLALLGGYCGYGQEALPDSFSVKGVQRPELGPNDTITVPGKISDGTVVPASTMEWYWVTRPMPKAMQERLAKWTRLRNAVYVTYPYARKAGAIMNEMNTKLESLTSSSQRKAYVKTREAELKKEFTDPLSNLSVYQGKVLMKLINRQTGNNCYDIIKEYKGGITARFWQTLAFFFNSNLKQPYKPLDEDKEIESIVMEVEKMYAR